MVIQSCAFTIHYAPNAHIRESLFNLEAHLTDFQHPFTLVSLPQEAPMEIPRIIAETIHGHSQLTICGNNMQLNTRFDGDFVSDIDKSVDYIETKCNSILKALPIINGDPNSEPVFYYSGITMTLLFDETDGIDNPVEYINNNFLMCHSNLPVDEAQVRTAMVLDEKYYVNILLQNIREFMGYPNERESLEGLKYRDRLQVVLDVNDRYAFNYNKGYLSTCKNVEKIATLVKQFCSQYIEKYVKEGVLEYVK